MIGLYPIVRRHRRPLVPPEAPVAAPAAVAPAVLAPAPAAVPVVVAPAVAAPPAASAAVMVAPEAMAAPVEAKPSVRLEEGGLELGLDVAPSKPAKRANPA